MEALLKYEFRMYRKSHAVYALVSFWAWSKMDAMGQADEYAYENGYMDYELVKEDWK